MKEPEKEVKEKLYFLRSYKIQEYCSNFVATQRKFGSMSK